MDEEKLVLSDGKLKSVLECMLFVSPQPLSAKLVAESLEIEEAAVEEAMHELRVDYYERGLQIQRIAGGYQMCTRPEYSDYISKLLKPERTRLSRAALETVAIIAYRQPITQPEIDAVRGVNSDAVLKTLTERNLVRHAGRKETVGRPILYATSDEFLNYFGLNDLSELPDLGDVSIPDAVLAEQEAAETETEQESETETVSEPIA